jgi:hypothetical protein
MTTSFVMSSAVETSLIIFLGKSKRLLGPRRFRLVGAYSSERTGVFAQNDKEREGSRKFCR